MKKIIFLFAFCVTVMANPAQAQDFGRAATDFYVMETFTNPGQFGTIPVAGPYFPIQNVITNNAFTMLGGDYNNAGVMYTFVYQAPDYVLGIVDLNTGAVNYAATVSGIVGGQFMSQLSYNYTNDTFYAISSDPNNENGSHFYSLNLATGVLTEIGTGTGIPNVVAMEIDNNGIVYAADAVSGDLFTIDVNTGVGTSVGNMYPGGLYPVRSGFTVDHSTNTLYAVLQNRSGVIWSYFNTVNTTTGEVTELGFGGSRKYSLFVIKEDGLGVEDQNLESFTVYPNPAANVLKIDNPQGAQIKGAKLFDMLGRNTGAVLINGEMNIENLSKGMYLLQIETENGTATKKIVKK
ncbi:T9SS type A sorting domain-containing protein [Aequorivita todarodis]|uniref:T9SS type A sorting domain-containing protein n=1 Tax=Aequorivita todarodis TaxID=2036821 RepID=UPI0023506F2B|nr:T9SS type A sorting domain-containing protein [Aequorivita todarodis]MDC8001157.1 T9SS type A sorting domain-containing protein [Aequorivita todarodis]